MDMQKSKKPCLSVIIPVYNQQEAIVNIVNDCIRQNILDCQIIVVDDGSSDNTAQVCREIAEKNPGVSFYTINNSGPSFARAFGLKKAEGEYVYFADSDDSIPEGSFQRLLDKAYSNGKPDIVRGNFNISENGQLRTNKCLWTEGFVSKEGASDEVDRYHRIKNSSAFGYMWGAIYKREFLINSSVSMENLKLDFMEDSVFNLELFAKSPSYYVFNEPVYCYIIREGSLTSTAKKDFLKSILAVANSYGSFLEDEGLYDKYLDNYAPLIARCFCYGLVKTQMQKVKSLNELEEWIHSFATDGHIRRLLNTKNMIQAICTISSGAEKRFYSYCMKNLKRGKYKKLALIFKSLTGPMNIYIKLATRH